MREKALPAHSRSHPLLPLPGKLQRDNLPKSYLGQLQTLIGERSACKL